MSHIHVLVYLPLSLDFNVIFVFKDFFCKVHTTGNRSVKQFLYIDNEFKDRS